MSTLWTPEGERPIRRDPPSPAAPPDEDLSEEEVRAQMAELREELARTPAEMVIANHAFGLFELAALHLSLQPPQLDQARLAIDALGALVDGLGPRLGEPGQQLSQGLSQLRLAYVEILRVAQAGGAAGAEAGTNVEAGPEAEPGPDTGAAGGADTEAGVEG